MTAPKRYKKLPSQREIAPILVDVLRTHGGAMKSADAIKAVANRFELTDEQRSLRRKDGRPLFEIYIRWTRQDLVAEGVIDRAEYGVWRLAEQGDLQEPQEKHGAVTGAEAGLSGDRQILIALKTILQFGGSASMQQIYDAVEKELGGKKLSDQGKASLRSFVSKTAVERDLIRPFGKDQNGWQITEKGHALLSEESAEVTQPEQPQPYTSEDGSSVELLLSELGEAQYDSEHHGRFEQALANAFEFLGFSIKRIGGSGDTDVLLEAPIGRHAYKVVVDGKSRKSGKFDDTTFFPITQHRNAHRAKYAIVVAPGFGGGNILSAAKASGIALLSADDLGEVIRLHARSPFNLLELEQLFSFPGEPEKPLHALQESFSCLLDELPRILVAELLELYSLGAEDPITAEALIPSLLKHFREMRYRREEVDAALDWLASPFIRAMRKEDGGYLLTMPLATLEKRLRALAEATGSNEPI